jgi:hypothetical protein
MMDFLLHMMSWPSKPVYSISEIAPVRGKVGHCNKCPYPTAGSYSKAPKKDDTLVTRLP